MESLIHAFGIDVRLITIQIINFTVLAGLLSYLLYKPLLKILKEREETIAQGVKDAEAAGQALSAAEDEKKTIVSQAHQEAVEINERATGFAEESAAKIRATAEEEAAQKIKAAEERSRSLAEEAKRASEAEIAKLAVLAAERVLSEKKS